MNPYAAVPAKVNPSIGRIVNYVPSSEDGGLSSFADMTLAALIVAVWDPRTVNLLVFDRTGAVHTRPYAVCYPEDQPAPVDTPRWLWPVISGSEASHTGETPTPEKTGLGLVADVEELTRVLEQIRAATEHVNEAVSRAIEDLRYGDGEHAMLVLNDAKRVLDRLIGMARPHE